MDQRSKKPKKLAECRICGEVKPHTIRSNGKLQTMCVECKSAYNKIYYEETKDKYNPNRAIRRIENRQVAMDFIRSAKNVPCTDCGVRYPYFVMQFDHIKGEKRFNLSNGTAFSLAKIQEEIEKCEVVCANCHMYRTHQSFEF